MTRQRKPWAYRGAEVWPADLNGSGVRWYARMASGAVLRADSKASMRELVRYHRAGWSA